MFTAGAVYAESVQFRSNQLTPVQEADIFRNAIMKDSHISADFETALDTLFAELDSSIGC